jgi:hypothetical protein
MRQTYIIYTTWLKTKPRRSLTIQIKQSYPKILIR